MFPDENTLFHSYDTVVLRKCLGVPLTQIPESSEHSEDGQGKDSLSG